MNPSLLLLILAAVPHAEAPEVALEVIATGLTNPVAITHAGDARLFITQQAGIVRIHDGTQLLPQPFLDIRAIVQDGGERGLLSAAFHPRHAENGFFFVNYTDNSGATVVARYRVLATDPDRADPGSARVILRIEQPFSNHNGGQLQFGPDGYLYVGMGDGGSGGDPGNRAQDPASLLGKMLRIDVDAGDPYAIPPSNPWATHATTRREIWATGLRNPWRFSFDRVSGDLWIADVGQGSWEEVNHQPASSIGGENYGWRVMEGTHCFDPSSGCDTAGLTMPVIEYGHTGGACSVTGGVVYRGWRSPRLHGLYLYGDFCSGAINGARLTGDGVETQPLFDATFLVSSFGEDATGEVYVADYSGGRILRIYDARRFGPKRRAVRH